MKLLKTSTATSNGRAWPLTLLYDGACPVCNLEMDNLMIRNTLKRLAFIDISQPGFDPSPYGASLAAMGESIHGVWPDGALVTGTQTLRLAYGAVGLGHLVAPTGLPLLKPLFDLAYAVMARNRYGISRVLAPVIGHIAARRALRRTRACMEGACEATSTARATPSNTNPGSAS